MKIDTDTLKKQVILHLPYLLFLLVFAKLGQAVRLAPGADASQKLLGLSEGFSLAFQSMWPGAALDWLAGNVSNAGAFGTAGGGYSGIYKQPLLCAGNHLRRLYCLRRKAAG